MIRDQCVHVLKRIARDLLIRDCSELLRGLQEIDQSS